MKRYLIGLSILVFLLFPLPAHAAEPLDVVKGEVNKVLDVLRDKSLSTEAK